MARVNFSRAELELEQTLHNLEVKQLLHIADLNASLGILTSGKTVSPREEVQKIAVALRHLLRDVRKIHLQDKNALKTLGIDPKLLLTMLEKPSQVSPEDWKKIQKIRETITQYKEELKKKLKPLSDQELIDITRKRQKEARFNVRSKWLPLDP